MIYKRIKEIRIKHNLKLKDLAKMIGMSSPKLSKIESGTNGGSFSDFEMIISKLATTPEEEYYLATGKQLQHDQKKKATPSQIDRFQGIIETLIKKLPDHAHIETATRGEPAGGFKRKKQKIPEPSPD